MLSKVSFKTKLVLFLYEIESIPFDDFWKKYSNDETDLLTHPSFKFYNFHLVQKNESCIYPAFHLQHIQQKNFYAKFHTRFQRLSKLSKDIYCFQIESTNSDLNQIQSYARSKNASRIIVFEVDNPIEDFVSLMKILKMNSFLFNRDASFSLA